MEASRKLLGEQVAERSAYVEAGYAFALAQAVHDRRTALGLSQSEPARRAGMTQVVVRRRFADHIEAG